MRTAAGANGAADRTEIAGRAADVAAVEEHGEERVTALEDGLQPQRHRAVVTVFEPPCRASELLLDGHVRAEEGNLDARAHGARVELPHLADVKGSGPRRLF